MENEILNELVENTEDSVITEVPVDKDNTQIFLVINQESKTEGETDQIEIVSDEPVLREITVTRQVITPSDTNGLKSTVLSLIGDYETVVTDYTYQTYNGSTQHSIDVQPDAAWIVSAALFALCLYSCLKMWSLALRGNHRRR